MIICKLIGDLIPSDYDIFRVSHTTVQLQQPSRRVLDPCVGQNTQIHIYHPAGRLKAEVVVGSDYLILSKG